MSRKSILLGLGILLLVTSSVSAGLVFLVRREPDFYRSRAVEPGEFRRQYSRDFEREFSLFYGAVNSHYERWAATFKEEEINSYFDEDFVRSGLEKNLLPRGVSAPRVAIEPDRIRLAFRYGSGTWSTIVSIDIRLWLITKEPNVVALELEGLHAGSVPISAQSLLDRIEEMAHGQHVQVSWYRHNGNPVALLHFQADRPRPTVQLQHLQLEKGRITIGGRSTEPAAVPPASAMLPTESDSAGAASRQAFLRLLGLDEQTAAAD
jgi:hypothetical protein